MTSWSKIRRPSTAGRRSSYCSSNPITIEKNCPRRRRRRRRRHNHDWSNICIDALQHIVQQKLPSFDTLTCRAVCSSWRALINTHISSILKKPPITPIFWSDPYSFLETSKGCEGNLHRDSLEFEELIRLEGVCVGYSYGCFIFWSMDESRWFLFHHQLRLSLTLPLISGKKHLERAVMWGDPILAATSSYGIVVTYDDCNRLMFAKSGATEFVDLECQDRGWDTTCLDLICINGCVYAITGEHYDIMRGINNCVEDHRMEAWDCVGEDNPRKVFDFKPSFRSGYVPACQSTLHLVESEGDLLLVTITRPNRRYIPRHHNDSTKFRPLCRVYKMDFKEKEWVYMDSLGDRVLFIMEYQTMSLCAREFPQYQRNSIYFRHYIPRLYFKDLLGVFNYEDGSEREIYTKEVNFSI